jgi:hypothetical protein
MSAFQDMKDNESASKEQKNFPPKIHPTQIANEMK